MPTPTPTVPHPRPLGRALPWSVAPGGDGLVTVVCVPEDEVEFPAGSSDEWELMMQWLRYLRGAVLRKAAGLSDEQGHWRPEGRLISVVGIINHLTRLEWRWIDGAFDGAEVSRTESEFAPGSELSVDVAVRAYRDRAAKTDAAVRAIELDQPSDPSGWGEGKDLRWVLLHLINETATPATQTRRASYWTEPQASKTGRSTPSQASPKASIGTSETLMPKSSTARFGRAFCAIGVSPASAER